MVIIMKLLTTFVLVGTVDSMDEHFATVEINTNPPAAEASVAVMPVTAFPCMIEEGKKFYIVKLTPEATPLIMCSAEVQK